MNSVTFYFVRHGETEWNAKNLFQGHQDIPLNEKGQQQARDCIETIKTIENSIFFSSPLTRAKTTAEIATGNKVITLIDDLKECNSPQGAKFILERKGITKMPNFEFLDPQGESSNEFIERVQRGITQVFEQAGNKTPVVFAHGGTCAALCEIFNIQHFTTPNCEVFEFIKMANGYSVQSYKEKVNP